MLWHTGKLAEAEAELRKALAIYQKLADDNPAVTDFRSGLAQNHFTLGHVLSSMGKPVAAEAEYRKALAIRQKLADDNPAVTWSRFSLAHSHDFLGGLLSNTGKPAEAEAEFRKAMALYQKLADDDPAVTNFPNYLAWSHRARRPAVEDGQAGGGGGRVPQGAGDPAEAGRRQPRRTGFRSHLADFHLDHAILLSGTGKPAEGEAEYRKALAIRQKLADDNPAVTEFPQAAWRNSTSTSASCCRRRASRRRRRPSSARRWRSGRSWSTTTPLTSVSAVACPTTI